MSTTSLADLLAQHRALETELAEAIAHPASTDAEIASIKRQKLKVKDLISKLKGHGSLAA
jgi:hypothetical protein